MFLMFTPYTYLFLVIYTSFLLLLSSLSNFYFYWFVMELMTLLLVGLSYTLFTNGVSQLMVYFLVQSLSSFVILVSYLFDLSFFLSFAFLLNLGMFPFVTWYLSSLSRFPNFVFWLTGTLHNLPPLFILLQFNLFLELSVFWVSVVLNTAVAGFIILFSNDLRIILIASSIGNNSWFLFSELSSVPVFISFIAIYSFFLALLLMSFNQMSKHFFFTTSFSSSFRSWAYFLSLSGLPPFPIFYLNIAVILTLFSKGVLTYYFFPFLLFAVFIVAGYVNFIINTLAYRYSSSSIFLVA